MRDSILEIRGTYKGHKWGIIFRNPLGYRCGYVEAPEILNKRKSELEDLYVHGGVTYIEHFNPLDHESTPNFWIGFDCMQASDGLASRGEEPRSQEYCAVECKKLIDQLIELESMKYIPLLTSAEQIQSTYKGCEYWIEDNWGDLIAKISIPESLHKYCTEIKRFRLSPGIVLYFPPTNKEELFAIDWTPFHYSFDSIEELKTCCEKIIDKLIELKSEDHSTKED